MRSRLIINYTCADCGAQAVSAPGPDAKPGEKSGRVMVPHELGCPMVRRLAELRKAAGR